MKIWFSLHLPLFLLSLSLPPLAFVLIPLVILIDAVLLAHAVNGV